MFMKFIKEINGNPFASHSIQELSDKNFSQFLESQGDFETKHCRRAVYSG